LLARWSKPDGGNAITHYRLKWKRENDRDFNNMNISHDRSKTDYEQVISELEPGTFYEVKINAYIFHNSQARLHGAFSSTKMIPTGIH